MTLNNRNEEGLNFSGTIEAIYYSTLMGSDIINACWGVDTDIQSSIDYLEEAIEDAGDMDVLFVASAGNVVSDAGHDIDIYPHYPASYDCDNIIAVAATDLDDNLLSYLQWPSSSNYGSNSVDVGAPGAVNWTTFTNNRYEVAWCGTSFAAPHVTGLAALLKSYVPVLTHLEIKRIIMETVDPQPSLEGKVVTGGRINAHKALSEALSISGWHLRGIESGDYDGDSKSDAAVFRPSNGFWNIRNIIQTWFGKRGDIPISGDYNGGGSTDIAIFRPSNGLWAARGVTRIYFGTYGDFPVPRDYDGDGSAKISIFRPTIGLWALRNTTRVYFGGGGDIPVPRDYDGDGDKDIAIFRPSSGLWAVRGITRSYFGGDDDISVPGDYDGDGSADIAIFRPSNGLWVLRNITRSYYGTYGDLPVPGDYNGTEGTDIAIFRPSTGLWAVRNITRVYLGGNSDIPVSGPAQ